MADKLPFEQPLRLAMEANLRFYESLGQVTQDYWKAVFGILDTLPLRLGTGGAGSASTPAPARVAAAAAVLVLEGQAGVEAQGVFMVENRLPRTVSTAVVTSAFADPSGRALQHPVRVVPNVVTLEPGGRTLVQIFAPVTDQLQPDVAYRGEVNVPGLSEQGIPVLLRRHPTVSKAESDRPRRSAAPARKRVTGQRPSSGRPRSES